MTMVHRDVFLTVEKTELALELEEIDSNLNFDLDIQWDHDAGIDIKACMSQQFISIPVGQFKMIPTGLKIQLDNPGWEIQVRSRSGLAAEYGIFVLNSPGTIDYQYRREIFVILFNAGTENFKIYAGDRIAQLCVREIPTVYIKYGKVEETKRDGFGSTGIK